MPLRLAFMGTPDFAVPALSELLSTGHEIASVYCQPPRPAGRGMDWRKSPIQVFAEAQGLLVRTPRSMRLSEVQAEFAALSLDAAVVVGYGLLLPAAILTAPREGCFNLHPSKLPRWRGAAPIQRTLMAGDSDTAVMIMRMDEGLDTGPVCLAESVAIDADVTAGDLHNELARRGADLMLRALAALERGSLTSQAQSSDGVTYAAKIDKSEARIDWNKPARAVHNHMRGLSPFPGAWFEWPVAGATERVKVLRSSMADGAGEAGVVLDAELTVACGTGAIRLLQVQRAGRKSMSAAEFLRGMSWDASSLKLHAAARSTIT